MGVGWHPKDTDLKVFVSLSLSNSDKTIVPQVDFHAFLSIMFIRQSFLNGEKKSSNCYLVGILKTALNNWLHKILSVYLLHYNCTRFIHLYQYLFQKTCSII